MIPEAISKGAVGAVSGFANAIPELIAHLVRTPTPEAHAHVTELREMVRDFPFHAMLRHVLTARSVAIFQDVRPPLRSLTVHESELLDGVVRDMLEICKVTRDSSASG
jgi:dihydrodipicolinate synthase/N-acetylneuraminate lyase